jgi:hypothetical protein
VVIGGGKQYFSTGYLHEEKRYLSHFEMRIAGPLLLSSAVQEDNVILSVDLTNPDIEFASGDLLPLGTLHIHRNKFIAEGTR